MYKYKHSMYMYMYKYMYIWSVVEPTLRKKMSSSARMMTFPSEWENKSAAPNHQPATDIRESSGQRLGKSSYTI